jgi:RimJ/RimL family protein N-acetyltransferase
MTRNHETTPENVWPETVVIDDSLAISRLIAADAPEFYTAIDQNRERLGRHLEWASHYTAEKAAHDCQVMEAEMERGNTAAYKIQYNDEFAGCATLTDHRHDEAELSIWLTEAAMGNYVASRAGRVLRDIGFSHWSLAAVILHIEADNVASQNFAARIGARKILTATPASAGFEIWEVTRQEQGDAE